MTKETETPSRRRRRPRPTPKWLKEQQDLDDVARRRCLMILSVVSGEKPVTQAIEEAQISRQTYYQLEEKALRAMLSALMPGTTVETSAASPLRKMAELQAKTERLEQDKRRAERLLFLTRKVVRPGSLKSAAGRPRLTGRRSTASGKKPSRTSTATAAPAISIPKPAGAAAP